MPTSRSTTGLRPPRRFPGWLALPILALTALLIGCSAGSDEASSTANQSDAISALPDAKTAADRLRIAMDAVDQIDGRLAKELGQIGPALTDDQRRAYMQAFDELPEIKVARADYLASAIALDDELTAIVSDPDNLRTVMGGVKVTRQGGFGTYQETVYGPRDLYEEYKLLASTPVASGALRFGAHLVGHDMAYAAVGVDDQRVADEIFAPALPRALGEQLLDTGDSKSALDSLRKVIGPAKEIGLKISERIEKFYDDANVADLSASDLRIRGLGKALLAAGTVLAIWEVGDGVSLALHGDFKAAIEELVKGGPDAVAGLAQATTLFRQVIRGQKATEWAAKVGRVAARIGAGVGVVLDTIALIGDLKNWNASDADKVEVLGDLLAIAGGVAVMLGVGGPIGPVLAILSIGVHLFADFLRARAEEAKEHDEKYACLTAMGMDPDLRDTLLHVWDEALHNLREIHHFTPEHVQWLAKNDNHALLGDLPMPVRFYGMESLEYIFNLTGDQPYDFLVAVVGSESDPLRRRYMLESVLRDLEMGQGFSYDMSKSDALGWFNYESQGVYVSDSTARAVWQRAFQNARAYLAAH